MSNVKYNGSGTHSLEGLIQRMVMGQMAEMNEIGIRIILKAT